MESFFASTVEALELLTRTLCDTEPKVKTVDAVYIFGQTPDNEKSSLEMGAKLMTMGKAKRLVFLKTGTLVTGETFSANTDAKLIKLGVKEETIIFTNLPTGIAHTQTEAIAFVELAKKMDWQTVYITSPPFHQLRACAETVTAILKFYPELKVFNKTGKALPWTTQVVHSQNILIDLRCNLIKSEKERLDKYYRQGDLATAGQILDYLNNRDKE